MKSNLSDKIMRIGREAWLLGLVTGKNGNISLRRDGYVIMTESGACLGMLDEDDFVEMDLEGKVKKGDKPSTEAPMHLALYKNTDAKAVVHLHPPLATAYFLENSELDLHTFEEKLFLGKIPVIEQDTPSVTDIDSLLEAFKLSNIIVLKRHGVVAIGPKVKDAFFLIQTLEHAVKFEIARRQTSRKNIDNPAAQEENESQSEVRDGKKYDLFSKEQIDKIVDLVNSDEKFLKQANDTNLTLTLAIKMNETGQIYKFNFNKGKIVEVGNDENAEFVVSGPKQVWEAIFRRQIDPFVATTQKKLNLKGDFGKLSKWYAPFARLFALWQQAPIE